MSTLPDGRPLEGFGLRLAPSTPDDADELGALLTDPRIYQHGYLMHRRPTDIGDGARLIRDRYLGHAHADGRGSGRISYVVRRVGSDRAPGGAEIVGTSSLLEPDLLNESIHLGSTFFGANWWGTEVNPGTKLLMLEHCFEHCGFRRVKIQTDLLNSRSMRAIERLGAVQEGVLRQHKRREDGSFRDTVVYSILDSEWPSVRGNLERRLTGLRGSRDRTQRSPVADPQRSREAGR